MLPDVSHHVLDNRLSLSVHLLGVVEVDVAEAVQQSGARVESMVRQSSQALLDKGIGGQSVTDVANSCS